MLHRLREAMGDGSPTKFGGPGSEVESDETFIGPNPRKMHSSRRASCRRFAESNGAEIWASARLRLLEYWTGRLAGSALKVVPNIRRDTLQNAILNSIAPGSKLYTDDSTTYSWAAGESEFIHEVVNHAREYVRGQVHTQGIENFWSLLKRTLRGTYVAVEPFHLDRYLNEQVFRFNNRATKDNPLNDSDRFTFACPKLPESASPMLN